MALEVTTRLPDVVVRPAPLDRLPGSRDDDPFLRIAAAWLVGHPTNTATATDATCKRGPPGAPDLACTPLPLSATTSTPRCAT